MLLPVGGSLKDHPWPFVSLICAYVCEWIRGDTDQLDWQNLVACAAGVFTRVAEAAMEECTVWGWIFYKYPSSEDLCAPVAQHRSVYHILLYVVHVPTLTSPPLPLTLAHPWHCGLCEPLFSGDTLLTLFLHTTVICSLLYPAVFTFNPLWCCSLTNVMSLSLFSFFLHTPLCSPHSLLHDLISAIILWK